MIKSEQINELAAALSKAQATIDSSNEAAVIKAYLNKRFRSNQNNDKSDIGRLMEKIAFGSSDCWLWIGSVNRHGYGATSIAGENKAHRASWRLFKGHIPNGMSVLHKCDVRCCVNPEHLFIGTQLDNMRDCSVKGRIKNIPLFGEDNPMSKLTLNEVNEIRELLGFQSQHELSRKYNVSPMTINRIALGKTWNSDKNKGT